MRRSTRTTILGLVAASAITMSGWLTASVAYADDTPTPSGSSDPTPTATSDVGPDWFPETAPSFSPKHRPTTAQAHIARRISAAGTTAGNSFSSAVTLSSPDVRWPYVYFDNTGATVQSGEPRKLGPNGYFIARSMWAKWKAPLTGYITVLAQGGSPSFDAGLNVYTGTKINALKRVAWGDQAYYPVSGAGGTIGDDSPSSSAAILSLPVKAGTTYYFQIGNAQASSSSSPTSSGDSSLYLDIEPNRYMPPNDYFVNATNLTFAPGSGAQITVKPQMQAATIEGWEPTDNDHNPADVRSSSVWYKWTSPQTGAFFANACGYSKAMLAAYTADWDQEGRTVGFGDVKAIGFDDDGYLGCPSAGDAGGFLLLNAKKGKTYYFQVSLPSLISTYPTTSFTLQLITTLPYIDKLSMTSGTKNQYVTITGTHLNDGTTIVRFGTKVATIVTQTATSIKVKVPAQSKKGNFPITVVNTTPTPDTVSNAVAFTYK